MLDEIFFIDLPSSSIRGEIFSIHLAKRQLAPVRFDIPMLAEASEGFTGAEIEEAIVATRYAVAQDTAATMEIVLNENVNTQPLSVVRFEDIERLRNWANGRTVSAG